MTPSTFALNLPNRRFQSAPYILPQPECSPVEERFTTAKEVPLMPKCFPNATLTP